VNSQAVCGTEAEERATCALMPLNGMRSTSGRLPPFALMNRIHSLAEMAYPMSLGWTPS
jgi:hypothetical protein